ncbi:L-rhamnose-binding lectin SML-like [Sparus aurata]|uniref:L-rhamnose-binding lectin SML-like n=1 Tax=Sparus aurata TaxID=8175 RepID=UPI0011C0EEEF|nr:L-rhamnose-binding lectin SML-like [Sparus aurata]
MQAALYGRADRETCSEGRPAQQLNNIQCSQKGVWKSSRKPVMVRVCVNSAEFFSILLIPAMASTNTSTYLCIPAIHTVACEHSLAFLQCDEGKVIFVLGADYGRRDSSTCSINRPANHLQNTLCSRPTTKVAESCNGKSSCSVKASNSVFGDPCSDSYKYLVPSTELSPLSSISQSPAATSLALCQCGAGPDEQRSSLEGERPGPFHKASTRFNIIFKQRHRITKLTEFTGASRHGDRIEVVMEEPNADLTQEAG